MTQEARGRAGRPRSAAGARKHVAVYLPAGVRAELEGMAERAGVSVSSFVAGLVAERIKKDQQESWPKEPMRTCECYCDCGTCSLSGDFHVHAGEPCPEHPDAPGDH